MRMTQFPPFVLTMVAGSRALIVGGLPVLANLAKLMRNPEALDGRSSPKTVSTSPARPEAGVNERMRATNGSPITTIARALPRSEWG